MRITLILLIISITQVSASGYAQTITFKSQNATLKTVFKVIKKQTGFNVLWDSETINLSEPIHVDFKQNTLKEVLDEVLKKQALSYVIEKKTIVIRYLPNSAPKSLPEIQFADIKVEGRIVDENGKPLMGTTITVKGTSRKFIAGDGGYFTIDKVDANAILIFSYLGYETQEIKISKGGLNLKIILKLAENKMDNVVITGTGIVRKKESFTGSAATFSGEDLKEIGNKNIIESLKTLDPSFVIITNNTQGSNPNSQPNIEMRGKTTISNRTLNDQFSANPNQPLFILDGFESSLQTIYDLDMNRVASITLLKDAASTALYGAKAANGVVVVETKKPVPGQLRVNYTGDFSMDVADFNSYNMMNASEKLLFEKLAGVYSQTSDDRWKTDSIYNSKMAGIARGINTDWLSIPIQNGFTQRHSLQVSGGSNELLLQAGLNYKKQDGVMKGSNRDTWGGNMNLNYRKGSLNVNNILSISNVVGNDSPYGAFSDYAQANPYYPKTNVDGSLSPYLDPDVHLSPNPLYNAIFNKISRTKGLTINNNLQANYTFSSSLRLQGGVAFSRGNTSAVNFLPPDLTMFTNVSIYQKGSYSENQGESTFYSAFAGATYARVLGKHEFTTNLRGDINSNAYRSSAFSAVGFPYGTNGNPAFAYSYPNGARPSASTYTLHAVGALASLNYTYDHRYLLDATYRVDGASTFGANNLYKPFYAIGIGWNLRNESFLKSLDWLDIFKLRANVGYTGNENLGQFSSTSVYTFLQGASLFGQGLKLSSLGNPDLDWQNTRQISVGADFQFLNGRFSGYLEYFDKFTDPLALQAEAALPSSTGALNNVINVGSLNTRGYAFNMKLSPIYNLKERIIWTISTRAQTVKSKYNDLGDKLNALNKQQQNLKGMERYRDGYSPDDIWAVVSKGIDPATGFELFQKLDSTLTFTYHTDDIVKVGNTQPKIQGIINSSFTYKALTVGINIRYSFGGYLFNSALYNKVENISSGMLIYNQDKRALYDRWQKPGDQSQFKSIRLNVSTPISSRFVQKNNYFNGESFSLTYRLDNEWVKKQGMQTLNIGVYTNDIFRIESSKSERGTYYPYAKSVSLSLTASF